MPTEDHKFSSLRDRCRFLQPQAPQPSIGTLAFERPSAFEEQSKHVSTPTNPSFSSTIHSELKSSSHRRWKSDELAGIEKGAVEVPALEISEPVLMTWGSEGLEAPSTPTRGGMNKVVLVRTPSEAVRKYFAKAERPAFDDSPPPPPPPKRSPPPLPSANPTLTRSVAGKRTPPRDSNGSTASQASTESRRYLSPQKAPVLERGHSAPLILRPSPGRTRIAPRLNRGVSHETTIPEDMEVGFFKPVRGSGESARTTTASESSPDSIPSGFGRDRRSETSETSAAPSMTLEQPTPPFAAMLLPPPVDEVFASVGHSSEQLVSLNVGGTVFLVAAKVILRTPSRLTTWLRGVIEDQAGETITFGRLIKSSTGSYDAADEDSADEGVRNRSSQYPPYRRPSNPTSHFSTSTITSADDGPLHGGRIASLRPTLCSTDDESDPRSLHQGFSGVLGGGDGPFRQSSLEPESPLDAFFDGPSRSQLLRRPAPPIRRPSSEYSVSTPTPTAGTMRRRPSTVDGGFPQTATSSMFPPSERGSLLVFSGHEHEGHPMPKLSLDSLRVAFGAPVPQRKGSFPETAVSEDKRDSEILEEALSPMRLLDFGESAEARRKGAGLANDVEAARSSLSPHRLPKPTQPLQIAPRKKSLSSRNVPIAVFLDRAAEPYSAILHFLRHAPKTTECDPLVSRSAEGSLPRTHRIPRELVAVGGGHVGAVGGYLLELHVRLAQVRDEAVWLGMDELKVIVDKELEEVRGLLGGSKTSDRGSTESRGGWI